MQQVASTALLLASFTRVFEEYDLGSGQPLQLEWKSPAGADVRLRARGLRRRLYYRMDAIRAPGATPFSWPTAILGALQIPRADLGVVAWTRYQIGSSERDLYLPVQLDQKGRSAGSNQGSGKDRSVGYQFALMPGVEISEIYVSVAAVGRDGRATRFVRDGTPLGYGYYPSDRAIQFSMPAPGPPGIYYLEAAASLKTGGSTTLTLWIYLPG